jgi:competence protein ComEC
MSYSAALMILITNEIIKNEKMKIILIPLASFIGIMPFSIIYFEQLAPVGMLITPFLSVIMGVIITLSLLYLLFQNKTVELFSTALITGTIAITEMFTKIPMLENLTFLSLVIWSFIFSIYLLFLNKMEE